MYRRQIKQRSRVGFDVHNYSKSQNQYGTSSPSRCARKYQYNGAVNLSI